MGYTLKVKEDSKIIFKSHVDNFESLENAFLDLRQKITGKRRRD